MISVRVCYVLPIYHLGYELNGMDRWKGLMEVGGTTLVSG